MAVRSRRAKALFALGLALMVAGLMVLWVAPIRGGTRYEKVYIYNATTGEPVFYMLEERGELIGWPWLVLGVVLAIVGSFLALRYVDEAWPPFPRRGDWP